MTRGSNWNDFRKTLNLTAEDEAAIRLEKELILAIIRAREKRGMTQKQLSEACGISQPVIARLERSVHSPQVDTIIKILKPLGYTLAVVPEIQQ